MKKPRRILILLVALSVILVLVGSYLIHSVLLASESSNVGYVFTDEEYVARQYSWVYQRYPQLFHQFFPDLPSPPSVNYPQPPENATIIPSLEPIPFDLSLDTRWIVLPKKQSLNLTVTVHSTEKVDLLLTIGAEDYVPSLVAIPPELPSGIIAFFDRPEINLEADSEVTVNLTLSIDDQATSGTYTLQIFAVQETSHGSFAVGVPLQLTIPER